MKLHLGESKKSIKEILGYGERGRNTERKMHIQFIQFMYHNLQHDFWDPPYGCLEELFRQHSSSCGRAPNVLRYWYKHFLDYGEILPDTQLYCKHLNSTSQSEWTMDTTAKLVEIVTNDPNLYLDEIRERLAYFGCKWWSAAKIQRVLTQDLGWSLQVASVVAGQRNEEDRQQYKDTLEMWVCNAAQAVFIDESFKGRNASRRRRCWSQKNLTPIIQENFYGHRSKKYSLLAACDVDGFIPESCDIVLRDEDGTVDTERFLLWVQTKLCPMLGRYDRMEKRSVVVLDNATIHHDDRVVKAIEATGALVIYTAPYSPDLNPIEWMFAQYKKAVMRHDKSDWAQAHVMALHAISPRNARAYFRRCGVPGAAGFQDVTGDDDNLIVVVAAAAVTVVSTHLNAATSLYN